MVRLREKAQARGEAVEGETCDAYRKRLDAHRKELGRRAGRHDVSTWRAWLANRIGYPSARSSRSRSTPPGNVRVSTSWTFSGRSNGAIGEVAIVLDVPERLRQDHLR